MVPIKHNWIVEYGPYLILILLIAASYYFLVPWYRKQWGDKTTYFYIAIGVNVVVVLLIFWLAYVLIHHYFGDKPNDSVPDDPSNI